MVVLELEVLPEFETEETVVLQPEKSTEAEPHERDTSLLPGVDGSQRL